MKQYESMEVYERPSLVNSISDMYATCDVSARKQIVGALIDAVRSTPPPPLNNANFSLICAAIAVFGRIGDDSSEVLDCLDSFVTRDPNFHAIEVLGQLSETSDPALHRLVAWHRRVDKAQVAGYALTKIQRRSAAITDSFRSLLNDGRYDDYARNTAREFFERNPDSN